MISHHLGVLSKHFCNAWAMIGSRSKRPSQHGYAKQDAKAISSLDCKHFQWLCHDSSLVSRRVKLANERQISGFLRLYKLFSWNIVRSVTRELPSRWERRGRTSLQVRLWPRPEKVILNPSSPPLSAEVETMSSHWSFSSRPTSKELGLSASAPLLGGKSRTDLLSRSMIKSRDMKEQIVGLLSVNQSRYLRVQLFWRE